MNLALVPAINALAGVTNLLGSGTLKLYTGTQPSTPETALSGNTLLATFTFSAPAFGSASLSGGNEQQTASFVASSVTPVANGTCTFARAVMATAAWATSTAYVVGNIVTAGSNLYYCTKAGTSHASTTPTATTSSVTDNTAVWQYLGASTATVVADFTVGTSATDIIIGSTSLTTTVNVTISSFVLTIPAV